VRSSGVGQATMARLLIVFGSCSGRVSGANVKLDSSWTVIATGGAGGEQRAGGAATGRGAAASGLQPAAVWLPQQWRRLHQVGPVGQLPARPAARGALEAPFVANLSSLTNLSAASCAFHQVGQVGQPPARPAARGEMSSQSGSPGEQKLPGACMFERLRRLSLHDPVLADQEQEVCIKRRFAWHSSEVRPPYCPMCPPELRIDARAIGARVSTCS